MLRLDIPRRFGQDCDFETIASEAMMEGHVCCG